MRSASPSLVHAHALVRRYGRSTVSFQTLDANLLRRFDGGDFVAYTETSRAWVAAGEPIASSERLVETAARFIDAARDVGKRPRIFQVRASLAQAIGLAAIPIGEEPWWDPRRWPERVGESRNVREQLRRARAKGVVVKSLDGDAVRASGHLRIELSNVADRWLRARPMAPMGFVVRLDPFRMTEERRYFLAEREGRALAFLVASPVHARGGWLVEHLIRDPSAPNGTSELLVDAFMRAAGERGSRSVSLGLAPLSGRIPPLLRLARRLGRPLYDFDGLRAFKAKFQPDNWETAYLAFPKGERGGLAILDTLAAFAPGGFLRFGLATLFKESRRRLGLNGSSQQLQGRGRVR